MSEGPPEGAVRAVAFVLDVLCRTLDALPGRAWGCRFGLSERAARLRGTPVAGALLPCGCVQYEHDHYGPCGPSLLDPPAHSDGWQRPPHNGSSDSDGAAQS